jgi:hypothetical protein
MKFLLTKNIINRIFPRDNLFRSKNGRGGRRRRAPLSLSSGTNFSQIRE